MLRAGAQDYVGKAWLTPDSLTRTVENAMERWPMITEQKPTEAELQAALDQARQAARSRDEMVAMVSHDLKTPLNTLLMGISILEARSTISAKTS